MEKKIELMDAIKSLTFIVLLLVTIAAGVFSVPASISLFQESSGGGFIFGSSSPTLSSIVTGIVLILIYVLTLFIIYKFIFKPFFKNGIEDTKLRRMIIAIIFQVVYSISVFFIVINFALRGY